MAKMQANQMRAGMVIEFEGQRYTVLKQNIMIPGKGAAVIQVEMRNVKTGAVTLIQRFGSALNLNVHFHMLFLDGVYDAREEHVLRLHRRGHGARPRLIGAVDG